MRHAVVHQQPHGASHSVNMRVKSPSAREYMERIVVPICRCRTFLEFAEQYIQYVSIYLRFRHESDITSDPRSVKERCAKTQQRAHPDQCALCDRVITIARTERSLPHPSAAVIGELLNVIGDLCVLRMRDGTHSIRQMRSTGAAGSDLGQGRGSARGDRTSVLAAWTTRLGRPPGRPGRIFRSGGMPWRGRHP
jgi:hypothetical protein